MRLPILVVALVLAGCAQAGAERATPTTKTSDIEVTPPATFPDGTLNPCLLRDGGRVICPDWQYPVCTPVDFVCPDGSEP